MFLRLTLANPIGGYWDGGLKSKFDWEINKDYDNGNSQVGSWQANTWYNVKTGKTEKQTLANAKRRITPLLRKKGITDYKFEYII